jgi:hypothetical protein
MRHVFVGMELDGKYICDIIYLRKEEEEKLKEKLFIK